VSGVAPSLDSERPDVKPGFGRQPGRSASAAAFVPRDACTQVSGLVEQSDFGQDALSARYVLFHQVKPWTEVVDRGEWVVSRHRRVQGLRTAFEKGSAVVVEARSAVPRGHSA
jgi:hypothetical protein